jgi:queuine tRNA-ribosyltransferase
VVRAVDAQDLLSSKIQAVQMNVFHLMQRPGSSTIQALGGLHQMVGWPGPIFTDSGGFQVYSLIRQNPKHGAITKQGATFRLKGSPRKFKLTPEKSVRLQLSYGSDVVICLDDCTHPDDPLGTQAESVRRSVDWAKRGKEEYSRRIEQMELPDEARPLLMAVVQGGRSRELRRQCADQLLEIGFDAYGYGGWPIDSQGELLGEILAYTRELIPERFPAHGLGVGHPANIEKCVRFGYDLFDSTMPTRDARHGRLYCFDTDPDHMPLVGDWFSYIYISDKKHIKRNGPISPFCDCLCCSRYTLGYLHHLFKLNDSLYARLATLHNLRFMTQLMSNLRHQAREEDRRNGGSG